MNTARVLNLVLDQAADALAEAERALAEADRARRDSEQRLVLLTRYRDDYASRKPSSQAAFDVALHANARAFVRKLDYAVESQRAERDRLASAAGRAHDARNAAARRHESLKKLGLRREQAVARRAEKADQKLTDEAAARAVRRAALEQR